MTLAGLGPEFDTFIYATGQLAVQMAHGIAALLVAFAHLAIAGLPVLKRLVGWLVAFSQWLPGAIDDVTRSRTAPWRRRPSRWLLRRQRGRALPGLGGQ